MESPYGDMDSRLLKHFDRAKLYENSEFDQRYINKDLLHTNPYIHELKNIEDRYDIIEEIGRGGMKRIERAIDKFTDRTVALATIKSIENSEDIENFLREARLTGSLQHQNIIPVYDLGIDGGNRPYFTMKLIEGYNLNDIIKKIREGNRGYRGKYKLRVLLDIFLKLCDAVAYAHSHNIVHLDLKPHNVQVSDHGEVLLCDWGLARRLEDKPTGSFSSTQLRSLDDRESTLDTFIKGTPGFMSPEQASGNWNETSKKTDVFSLGAILYNILTLETPFENRSVERMINNTVNGKIIVPSSLAPKREIPDVLERICLKCLKVDKISRYVSVKKLADDIRAWEEGFVTSVEDPTLRGQMSSFYKRNKKACFVAVGVLAGFLFVTAFFLILLYKSADSAENARLETQRTLNNLMEMEKEKAVLAKEASFRVLNKSLKLVRAAKFDEALEPLSYALDLNPGLQEGWKLAAQIKLFKGDVSGAYRDSQKAGDRNLIYVIKRTLREKRDNTSGGLECLLENSQVNNENFWVLLLFERIDELPIESKVPIVIEMIRKHNRMVTLRSYYKIDDNRLIIDLSKNKKLEDITHLENLKIHELNLAGTSVARLKPLIGQPLEKLNLYHTNIIGIKALKDAPLKELNIEGSSFNDLSPLKGSPVEFIDLGKGKYNLNFLNQLKNLQKIELPKGLFTLQELEVLRPGIEVVYRNHHIKKGNGKK